MMTKSLAYFILFIVCAIASLTSIAQKSKNEDIRQYMPTESVDWKDANKSKNKPQRKHLSVIYKPRAYGILYGNPCAVDATSNMGFIYTIQIDGVPGSVSTSQKTFNNLFVNLKLIFTRSPFWKIILNKKIKECRERSGDFVG